MLVKFKNFDQYTSQYSNDATSFLNKVGIATSESIDFPYFEYLKSHFDLNESASDIPIIVSSDFAFESQAIYESNRFTYNLNEAPSIDTIYEDFSGAQFIPKLAKSIPDAKKLKFPVVAYGKKGESEFKTIGKLRSSEGIYSKFREKIVPKTKFNVLSFKGKPISIVERVNKFPLDVNLKRFKHLSRVNEISKKLFEKYDLDFYNIEILESVKGGLYINGMNKKLELNPHQAYVVYENAYEDFYNSRIPNWVKNKIITEHVSKYYKNKAYDAMLLKTSHTMDYSKYL